MNKELYLMLSRTEDEPRVDILTKSQLEKDLNENYREGYSFITDRVELPEDLMYFPSMSVFIMKGEIVVPKEKKVVEILEID